MNGFIPIRWNDTSRKYKWLKDKKSRTYSMIYCMCCKMALQTLDFSQVKPTIVMLRERLEGFFNRVNGFYWSVSLTAKFLGATTYLNMPNVFTKDGCFSLILRTPTAMRRYTDTNWSMVSVFRRCFSRENKRRYIDTVVRSGPEKASKYRYQRYVSLVSLISLVSIYRHTR